MSTEAILADLLEPLKAKLKEAQAEEAKADREYEVALDKRKTARETTRTIESMISRVKGEKVNGTGPKKGPTKEARVSPNAAAKIFDAVEKIGEGTAGDVMEETGLSEALVREGLRMLRNEERLRIAGTRPRNGQNPENGKPGKGGRGYTVFGIMPGAERPEEPVQAG